MVFIVSLLSVINKVNLKSIIFQRFKVMMTVNILITGLVYWTLLGKNISSMVPFALLSTVLAHAIVPILTIGAFIFESLVVKIDKNHKMGILKTALLNSTFPLFWFIVSLIIYFSLGAKHEDAVYSFLDFNSHWLSSTITVILITIAYPLITMSGTWLYSR